jgi:hypothetical protein
MVRGLNTPGHASSRTLFSHVGLCLDRTLCPQRDSRLETWKNLNFTDCNATKHLYSTPSVPKCLSRLTFYINFDHLF